MQNRKSLVRPFSRFPVSWPVLYGNETFLAEGTVLDLTTRGWRLAGSMPVVPGMRLILQVSIPERSTLLRVQQATVLWVKDHEFAMEAHGMAPSDHAWVTEFLHQKLGLRWMAPTNHPETSPPTVSPTTQLTLPPRGIPSLDEVLQQLLALQPDSTNKPANAQWDEDSDFQEGESALSIDNVPQKMWDQARGILRKMVALNEARARTGWDPITDN